MPSVGFETRDSSSQSAANLRLRPYGHRVRPIVIKFRIVCAPLLHDTVHIKTFLFYVALEVSDSEAVACIGAA
jgi:hypothetical protein